MLEDTKDQSASATAEGAAGESAESAANGGATAYGLLLERFRAALSASEPAIEPGQIRGATLEEVEASFTEAKALVERVRAEAQRSTLVSAGAPGRSARVPGSAFEKIRAGLSR